MPRIIEGDAATPLLLNKTRRKNSFRWAGTLAGLALLVLVGFQIRSQVQAGRGYTGVHFSQSGYGIAAVLLLFFSLAVESRKWQLLLRRSLPGVSFGASLRSVFCGIAASVVTPNRLGEYPGRMLRLERISPYKVATAAVLGSLSQFVALFTWGAIASAHYAFSRPVWWTVTGAILSGIGAVLSGIFFARYERFIPRLQRIPFLRKYATLGRTMGSTDFNHQFTILALSLLRFAVFTFQYWLMLRWLGVPLPMIEGFLRCSLFFWIMAVVPSIALAEIGVRGGVALFLFAPYSADRIGILAATLALWLLNLAIPSLTGALLLLRRPKP